MARCLVSGSIDQFRRLLVVFDRLGEQLVVGRLRRDARGGTGCRSCWRGRSMRGSASGRCSPDPSPCTARSFPCTSRRRRSEVLAPVQLIRVLEGHRGLQVLIWPHPAAARPSAAQSTLTEAFDENLCISRSPLNDLSQFGPGSPAGTGRFPGKRASIVIRFLASQGSGYHEPTGSPSSGHATGPSGVVHALDTDLHDSIRDPAREGAGYSPEADLELLRRAYVFSALEHKGQVRHSGEPYLVHPLEVADSLADMKLDVVAVAAGLLHDVVEDTLTTPERIAGALRQRNRARRRGRHQDRRDPLLIERGASGRELPQDAAGDGG